MPPYPITKSPIVAGLGSSSSNLFRCPADKDDSQRMMNDGNGPYYYSYSLTSFGLSGSENRGLSSINDGRWYPFKASAIKNPSRKIMRAEEQSGYKAFEVSDPTSGVINDGRWVPPGDVLTSRHSQRGNVAYPDGHAAAIRWRVALDLANSRPDL